MGYDRPDMPETGVGRCLCGSVKYEWRQRPLWACHCHCESCRRDCSAGFASFFGVADGHWAWTGAAPMLYVSSPGARRYFCGTCGSSMAFAADRFPGEVHFFAASMERPQDFAPTFHVHAEERLGWVHLADGLPRVEGANL